ncbi:MAG: aminoglycoside phosphotransferase family protein [Pseudonocardiaceae bacterium]
MPSGDHTFHERVRAVHGLGARAWLDDLPRVAERWRRYWALGPLRPYSLSYHWVAAADRDDGTPCVLKLAPPGTPELVVEARWLGRVGGRGAAVLLDADPENGALLLERIEPGRPLATIVPDRDDEACEAIATVAAAVRRPAATGLPTLADRVTDLTRHRGAHPGDRDPLPPGIVAEAEHIGAELLRTAPPDVLLHGDLHHDNVLCGDNRGWLAIDPHGLVGDPAYELAPLLYNPMPLGPTAVALAERRCRRLAVATGISEERIRGWGFVQAVLSAVWSLDEDPAPDQHVLAVAERLRDRCGPRLATA